VQKGGETDSYRRGIKCICH